MLTWNSRKNRRSMLSYVKLLLSFVAIVLLTNVVMAASMYVNYERHAVDTVQTYTVEELSQVSYSTNFMFEGAKLTLQQLYLNPAVLKLMNYDDLGELEAGDLLRQVGVVNINLPFVNSIYIYNRKAQKMYYDGKAFPVASFPDQDMIARLEAGRLSNLRPIARRILSPVNYTSSIPIPAMMDNVYTFVFLEGSEAPVEKAIILNVSQEWMKNTIESMNPASSSETLIAASNGTIVLSNERFPYLGNLNEELDMRGILAETSPSGYAVKQVGGQKTLVSYVSSDKLDWKYIRFTPYDAVLGKLKKLLFKTLVIFTLVTVLSVLAVLIISRAVYRFFNSKIREMEKKYASEKEAGYEKKQQFLRLMATRKLDDGFLQKGFSRFRIGFDPERSFVTVVLGIDRYDKHCREYSPEDRALLAYGVINIVDELAQAQSMPAHETVDLGNGFIAIVFNVDESEHERFAVKAEELARCVQDKSQQYLGLSLSVALGDRLEEIAEISGSVALCIETLDYRLFDGPKAVLYVSMLKAIKAREFEFPEPLLAELLEHTKAGDKEAVRDACRRLVESTRGYSITSLQTMVLQLAISTKEALKKSSLFADEIEYEQYIDIANRITRYETLQEISEQLLASFERIMEAQQRTLESAKKQERYSGILDSVSELFEQKYADPNLSPEMIAEQLGISAKYLRTLYKKASGESLGDQINRYRMERAKELLVHPDYSVQEVAVRSGFANINYFYTLFKKYNGVTPNEFRTLKSGSPKG
ncbi:MAG: hypothetical protein K0Q59_1917 [Paenibacillus sp.]|nr:hypothetical protein [Paenibacillus sp.]